MLEIWVEDDGTVMLKGRLDASQAEAAEAVMDDIEGTCVVDFSELDYISSAGLKVLLATQQRLWESGGEIRLAGMTPHVRMVFDLAGFDNVFKIS